MRALLLAATTYLALTAGAAYAGDGGGDGDDHLRQWALSVEQQDAQRAAVANHKNAAPYRVAQPRLRHQRARPLELNLPSLVATCADMRHHGLAARLVPLSVNLATGRSRSRA